MIDNYHVDGVIEIVLQSCHTFDVEAHYIKRFVTEEKGLPYLNIETTTRSRIRARSTPAWLRSWRPSKSKPTLVLKRCPPPGPCAVRGASLSWAHESGGCKISGERVSW